MTPLEIQFELKKRGLSQKQIALDEGVSEMMVSGVIHKNRVSNRIMRKISEKIKRDHRDVFSEYYLCDPKRTTSKTV